MAYAYAAQARVHRVLHNAPGAYQSAQQAVAVVEKLVGEETGYLYDLACHRALCGTLAGLAKAKPDQEQVALADRYASASMVALRQAVAAGYDNIAKLQTDPCLAPLRTRADFQTLVHELQQKLKAAKL